MKEKTQSERYENFAAVYDLFMDNIDYDAWSQYLVQKLQSQGICEGIVCELGCGTGSMTERLSAAGYDMIGIDASLEMLEAAQEKLYTTSAHPDILYLHQDMRSFELYGTVAAVVSVCDSMNYITEEDDLLQVFRLADNYLDPGGIFLFDMNMEAKYNGIGNSTIAENREEGSFIWENEYDPETRLNTYALTLFLPEGDYYQKYEELHVQRAYSVETVECLLKEAGLEVLGHWEAFTDKEVTETSERVYFLARECKKKPVLPPA